MKEWRYTIVRGGTWYSWPHDQWEAEFSQADSSMLLSCVREFVPFVYVQMRTPSFYYTYTHNLWYTLTHLFLENVVIKNKLIIIILLIILITIKLQIIIKIKFYQKCKEKSKELFYLQNIKKLLYSEKLIFKNQVKDKFK